jgi:hypothetical protein
VELLHFTNVENHNMATTASRKEGKTPFVKEVLAKNPRANAAAVNVAWKAAGKDGTISATLVNKLRSTLGLAGNLRARRTKRDRFPSAEKASYAGNKRGRKPKNLTTAGFMMSPARGNGRTINQGARPLGPRGRPTAPRYALEEVEADIDRLIFKVMALGGMSALEDKLRQARRLLYGGFAGLRG